MKDDISYKKGILIMIYVFAVIFMFFGISFSYFSARAKSENQALNTKSGKLSLSLEISSKYNGMKLIPSADEDIMKAYHQKCLDNDGKGACVAYDITVTNETAKQDVIGTIDFNVNHIENLSYIVLDENENIYQDITKIKGDTSNMPLGSHFILDNALETGIPTKRKFTLIIWLSNFDYDQNEDKNGSFAASVTYNSIYGQKLTSNVSETEGGE